MNLRLLSLMVVLVLLPPAWSQTAEELVTLALRQNEGLLAVRQQVASSRGGVTQARLRANPSVQLSGTGEIAGTQNNLVLGGSLPLELFGRRERRMEVAAAGVRMTEFTEAEAERQLRAEVELKFGEALAASRNLEVAAGLLDLNRKALALMEARVEQGAAPPLDASMLRVEVNRIDSLRADLEGKFGVSVLELRSLAGVAPDVELRLKGTLEPTGPEGSESKAVRPDVLVARAMEDIAGARLKQAQTEGRADASVSASYQRMNSSFDVNGLTASGQLRPVQGVFNFVTGGVSITLPLRNRNEGAIETAVAEVEAAKHRRGYAELIAAREVSAALLSFTKAKESLDIYRSGVRDQAAQNLEVIRRTYELGRTRLLDVIAEQRRFIEIETGYTEALSRYYQASVRLRTAGSR